MATSSYHRGGKGNIYQKILSQKVPLQALASKWVEDYEDDAESSLISLIQFVICSSGSPLIITNEMINNMNYSAIVQEMSEALDMERDNKCQITMKSKKGKKFCDDFCKFLQCLLDQCPDAIIYDNFLLKNLLSFLTEMTLSKVRSFRHTATLAVMKIVTALVDIAVAVWDSSDEDVQQENENKLQNIEDLFDNIFTSIFSQRAKDVSPEIVQLCMGEVRIWMSAYPQHFLGSDSYLKCIGINLYNKDAKVRLKCAQSLQTLYAAEHYKNEDFKKNIVTFTKTHQKRLISMTLDKDIDVAVLIFNVLTNISSYYNDILTKEDYDKTLKLVFSKHKPVALAAGEFFSKYLFLLDEKRKASETISNDSHKNAYIIFNLVQIFIEFKHPELIDYFVDSVIRCNEIIKDWRCMIALIIGQCEELNLNDAQISTTIRIMTSCIRQAATGKPPNLNEVSNISATAEIMDDQLHITQHLLPALPTLLNKFKSNNGILKELLAIPQYFDLELRVVLQYQVEFGKLLNSLRIFGETLENLEVLEVCANTLGVFCKKNSALSGESIIKCNELIGKMIQSYQHVSSKIILSEEAEILDENDLVVLKNVMDKLVVLLKYHNFEQWNIWNSAYEIMIKMKYEEMKLAGKVVKSCVSICYLLLLQNLDTVEQAKKSGSNIVDMVSNLRTNLHKFIDELKEMLICPSSELSEEAYLCICDLLVIFCKRLGAQLELDDLVYSADDDLIVMLLNFVENHVFINEDERESRKSRNHLENRRKLLSCFCKLIAYNMVPVHKTVPIFKNYIKYYDEYGQIIEFTLNKALEINRVNCAQTMISCLISIVNDMSSKIDRESCKFAYVEILARKFAALFGTNKVKNRKAITTLHRQGILYAMKISTSEDTPLLPNLAFFHILLEFVGKLQEEDKPAIQKFLNSQIPTDMLKNIKSEALLSYQKSLEQKRITETLGKPAPQKTEQKRRKEFQSNNKQDSSNTFSELDDFLRKKSGGVSKDEEMPVHSPASVSTSVSTPAISIIVTDQSDDSIHGSESPDADADFLYPQKRKYLSVIPEKDISE